MSICPIIPVILSKITDAAISDISSSLLLQTVTILASPNNCPEKPWRKTEL